MTVSVFEIYNYVFLALYAVSMPCYAIAKLTDNGLRGGLLVSAGELIDAIWFPGTRVIRVGGGTRYVTGSRNQILKSVCVACPVVVEDVHKTVANAPFLDSRSSVMPKQQLRQCVRTGLGEPERADPYITFKGPDRMSPKEYVLFQIFGSQWQKAVDQISKNTTNGMVLANSMVNLPYNKSMFPNGTPFAWSRFAHLLDEYNRVPQSKQREIEDAILAGGYYTIGGAPFIPPKVWDIQGGLTVPGKAIWLSDSSDPFTFSGGSRHVGALGGFPAQYKRNNETELEYWAHKSTNETPSTGLLSWSDQEFADYAQIFFRNVAGPMKWSK